MRRHELDYILRKMLNYEQEVSDLNFTVDKPPQVESFGELIPIELEPPIERLTPFQTEMVALNLVSGSRRLTEDLMRHGSCDASYAIGDSVRFRVNIFSQRGNLSIVLRKLNTQIPTLEELGLPTIFQQASKEKTGLILVTGATGSGKTTTLAGLLDEINNNRAVHVITLEDPVEYVHTQKTATFNQRELGLDFDTFASGLRAALRQAPKVILVGEMRDRETVEIGLTAAETGHLVLASLHTIDAGQTINRILGMFDTEEQEQVRVRLADTLRWIVSQRLVPRVNGGRTALLEIMGSNLRTKETVQMGESEGKTFYEIIEASFPFGWRTFDHTALEAYESGLVSEDTALAYCTRRSVVSRGIDNVKKRRGESTSEMVNLRMKVSEDPQRGGAPPVPVTLKLK
jgi:twitching motility protein PilT